jgi:hypothetical protein
MTGSAFQSATYIPNVTLGLLNSNGKGNASASYDEFRSRSRRSRLTQEEPMQWTPRPGDAHRRE